jgi:hypothetical protein
MGFTNCSIRLPSFSAMESRLWLLLFSWPSHFPAAITFAEPFAPAAGCMVDTTVKVDSKEFFAVIIAALHAFGRFFFKQQMTKSHSCRHPSGGRRDGTKRTIK